MAAGIPWFLTDPVFERFGIRTSGGPNYKGQFRSQTSPPFHLGDAELIEDLRLDTARCREGADDSISQAVHDYLGCLVLVPETWRLWTAGTSVIGRAHRHL